MPEVLGSRSLSTDVRVASLLLGETRRRTVTRVFGIPADDQSLLATAILTGAAASVLGALARRPWSRPSGADAAMGGSVLNAALRGIAGEPSRTMPLAGGLIAVAVVGHSLRPAVVGSAREVRLLAHETRAAFHRLYHPDPGLG
jgi:hypothetical protein